MTQPATNEEVIELTLYHYKCAMCGKEWDSKTKHLKRCRFCKNLNFHIPRKDRPKPGPKPARRVVVKVVPAPLPPNPKRPPA